LRCTCALDTLALGQNLLHVVTGGQPDRPALTPRFGGALSMEHQVSIG